MGIISIETGQDGFYGKSTPKVYKIICYWHTKIVSRYPACAGCRAIVMKVRSLRIKKPGVNPGFSFFLRELHR
jgi:hypothetical protein